MIVTKQSYKQNKMKDLKQTKLFVVLDEVTLKTMKGKNNKTAKFASFDTANWAASGKLHLWTVVEVAFQDKFFQHTI